MSPLKILIIDDEEAIRDACSQVLTKDGYEVTAASDGITGLDLVRRLKPDVVLVDLKMPGISGQAVLERIGELDESIVCIVITGYATAHSAEEALRLGALDFLPKPFSPVELRSVIQRALDRKSLSRRIPRPQLG